MAKTKILKLKEQSRAKWRRIVKDLCSDNPKLEVSLGCDSCGYCLILGVDDPCQSACRGCCLFRKSLCNAGHGAAYRAVSDYYFNCSGDCIAALEGAVAILVTIERELGNE